jgi:hypothetical protein
MPKHKSPQDLMAARNPLARRAVEPVDIYTPPIQVEAGKTEATLEPINSNSNSNSKDEHDTTKELGLQTTTPKKKDTVKSYSTYLYQSQIKGIKLRAIEQDVNDFAIVQEAIAEYFKKHPL